MAQFSTKRNNLLNNNDTLYEVVMIAGQSGPSVFVPEGNLNGSTDAFGRLRQSTPFTLFDSHNLLSKNDKFDESTSGSGSVTYNANESAILLNVSDADGDEVVRQSYRHRQQSRVHRPATIKRRHRGLSHCPGRVCAGRRVTRVQPGRSHSISS